MVCRVVIEGDMGSEGSFRTLWSFFVIYWLPCFIAEFGIVGASSSSEFR
jgi:hypothetical protein